jgi:hypothetical protein
MNNPRKSISGDTGKGWYEYGQNLTYISGMMIANKTIMKKSIHSWIFCPLGLVDASQDCQKQSCDRVISMISEY